VLYRFWSLGGFRIPLRILGAVGRGARWLGRAAVTTIIGAGGAGQMAVHMFGYLAIAWMVTLLVTQGDAASTGIKAYRASPMADNLLSFTASRAPAIHKEAVRSIGNYCEFSLGVEGVGRSCMRETDARDIAGSLGIPFVGIADREKGAAGNRLVILDSGASIDIACDTTYLVPGTKIPCERLIAGVGGVHTAMFEANFKFPVRLEGGGVYQLRRRALIMPECPHHLLSACSAARDGEFSIHVGCGAEESYLTLRNGKRAPIINAGVLVLPPKSAPVLSASEPADAIGAMLPQAVDGGTSKGTSVKGPILHTRFGHRNARALRQVPTASSDAPDAWRAAIDSIAHRSCDACERGKAHQIHSTRRAPPTQAPGDLVSFNILDACMPHRHGAQRNAIVFTDHYSGFKKAYLLRAKSDAPEALDRFLNFCRSKGVIVRRLHRDGAREFLDTTPGMSEVLKRHNLLGATTTSSAYVHTQNAVAERANRTLQDGVRARLLQANMPPSFWWFAIQDTLEIDAYIPLVGSPSETAYSRFHGCQPSITHVRSFGCLAYALLYHPVTKMAERAIRGIYIGRASDQSAYLVQDVATGKIISTPHVRFVEEHFPGIGALRGEQQLLAGRGGLFSFSFINGPSTQGGQPTPEPTTDDGPPRPPLATNDRLTDVPPAPWQHQRMPVTQLDPLASDIETEFEVEVETAIGRAPPLVDEAMLPNSDVFDEPYLDQQPVAVQWDSTCLTRHGRGERAPQYEPTMIASVALSAPGGPFILYLCSRPRRSGEVTHQLAAANSNLQIILVDVDVGGAAHDLRDDGVC